MLLRQGTRLSYATAGRRFGAGSMEGQIGRAQTWSRLAPVRIFSDFDGLPAGRSLAVPWPPLKEGAISARGLGSGSALAQVTGIGSMAATAAGVAVSLAAITGLKEWAGTAVASAAATLAMLGRANISSTIRIGFQPSADEIAGNILDAQDVETGLTLRQALRLICAVLGGRISGSTDNAPAIRAAKSDHKVRVSAVTDAQGNRISIALDLT